MPKIREYARTDFRGPEFSAVPDAVHAGTGEQLYRAALYGCTLDGSTLLGDARKPYGEAYVDAWKWSHLYGRKWHNDNRDPRGGHVEMGKAIYSWSPSDHGARVRYVI